MADISLISKTSRDYGYRSGASLDTSRNTRERETASSAANGIVSNDVAASDANAKSNTESSAATEVSASLENSSLLTQPVSPRIAVDPLTNVVVTEYLNSGGNVVQIPSEVALSYLRTGLLSNGRPEQNAEQSSDALSRFIENVNNSNKTPSSTITSTAKPLEYSTATSTLQTEQSLTSTAGFASNINAASGLFNQSVRKDV